MGAEESRILLKGIREILRDFSAFCPPKLMTFHYTGWYK